MTVNHKFKHALFAFFLLFSLSLFGESKSDSLAIRDSLASEFYSLSDVDFDLNSKKFLDLSLDGFQHYDPLSGKREPIIWSRYLNSSQAQKFREYGVVKNLGNHGAAHHSLRYEPSFKLGADVGINNYHLYEFDKSGVTFFPSTYPITELFYVMGSKKLQQFEVMHSQYLLRGLHVGLDYRRINSVGFYQHQKTDHSNFKVQADYRTRNGRYTVFAYGIWNSLASKENGGLLGNSFFEDSESITSTIDVSRDSAESAYRMKNFFLKQFVVLGKKRKITINDSTNKFVFRPSSRIYHSIEYLERSFLFEDNFPDTVFYPDVFENWSYTSDIVKFLKVENVVGWTTMSADNSIDSLGRLLMGVSLKHEYAEYHQSDVDSFMTNMMVNFNIGKYQYSRFLWGVAGAYVFDGANAGDYSLSGNAAYLLKNGSNRFDFGAKYALRTPGLMETTYSGNHYQWTNKFDKEDNTCVELSFTSQKINFRLGGKATFVRDLIYYSRWGPAQLGYTINMASVYLKQDFRVWKFHLDNKFIYQHVTSKDEAIAIPEYVSYHSLYLKDRIFKDNMGIQVGADLYFNTSYYAKAYMPATGQFFRQDSKKVGNYPFVDLFLNMSVKKARMFIKVTHVNSGMAGRSYYSAPGYPAAERTYIFGVSWIFFN